jgi:hypothetical protein
MTTLDEMWQRLAQHQPYADKYGYGPSWMIMCKVRNHGAVHAARRVMWRDHATPRLIAARAAMWAVTFVAKSSVRWAVEDIEEAEQAYDNA